MFIKARREEKGDLCNTGVLIADYADYTDYADKKKLYLLKERSYPWNRAPRRHLRNLRLKFEFTEFLHSNHQAYNMFTPID